MHRSFRERAGAAWDALQREPLLAALLLLCVVAGVAPIWATWIIPQGDVYQHLAIVQILHDYDAPGSIYPHYFELPDGVKPNLLYYYVVHWLAYLMPFEVANKLLLSTYAALVPLSMLYFLTVFGRPRRLALLATFFVYTGLFRTGFAGYLLSIPLYFIGVAQFYRWAKWPSLRRGLGVFAMASVLFFTHAQMYLLYGLTVALTTLLLWGGPLVVLRRVTAPLGSMLFFVPWFLRYFVFVKDVPGVKEVGEVKAGFGAFYHTPGELMERLHKYVLTYFRDSGDELLMLAIFGLLLMGLILRGHGRSESPTAPPDTPPSARERLIPELLTLLLAASVFLLPVHIKGQAVISVRHIPLTVLSFIPWLGWPRRRWTSAAAGLLVTALVLGQSVYIGQKFKDYERELDGYEQLFEDLEPWSKLYKVSGRDLFSRVAHGNVFWHLHYLHLVWNGGITDVNFAEHVTCPIQYRRGMIPPHLPREITETSRWRYYDYFLVQRREMRRIEKLEPWLRPIAENRGWVMYETRERAFAPWWRLDELAPQEADLVKKRKDLSEKPDDAATRPPPRPGPD